MGRETQAVWPSTPEQSFGWKLPRGAGWSTDKKGDIILHIANSDSNGAAFAVRGLNLGPYAGKHIKLSADVKAVDVSKPSASFLGIKFMLPYEENGKKKYPAAMDGKYGNFDYKAFSMTIKVPSRMEKPAQLILGLQNSTGDVYFRNLKIQVIKQESFVWPRKKTDLKKWRLPAQFDWTFDPEGRCVLHVVNREQGKGGLAALPLDLKKYAGKLVEISTEIKAVDVSKPKVGYLGVKFMLPHKVNGVTNWPSATDGLYGSFDFKRFQLTVALPSNIQNATVNFGLQDSTGNVYFRDFKIRVVPQEVFRPVPFKLPGNYRCEYSESVRNAPVSRGVMTPDPRVMTRKDIHDLAEWGADLVRWQFICHRAGFPDEYRKALDASIDKLISFAPDFKNAGIKVVFDMHSPPGGRYKQPAVLGTAGALAELDGSACLRLFMEDFYFDLYVRAWRHIAERLKNIDVIWGYDLLNEPTSGGQKVRYNYLKAQYEAAKAIRKVEPEIPIIIESDEWADINTFAYFKPLPLENIFYEFHFYAPGVYTHQGVGKASLDKFKRGTCLKISLKNGLVIL